MFSPDSPQSAKPVSVSIPASLAAKIAKLADVRESSFSEALVHLVEKGFGEIDKKIAVFYGSGDIEDLSPRQRDVLDCLRNGLAVKEIADKLKVSEVTVRTHILRIRQRLGCSDILELRMPGA